MLIKNYNKPIACPTPADLVSDYTYRNDFGNYFYPYTSTYLGAEEQPRRYVYGPASSLNESRLALMADVYSKNHTRSKFSLYFGDDLCMLNFFETTPQIMPLATRTARRS